MLRFPAAVLLAGWFGIFLQPAQATITSASASNDSTIITYEIRYTGTWDRFQVLVDTDRNPDTGYRDSGIGADYLLQGDLVRSYTGTGGQWGWSEPHIGVAGYANNGSQVRWRVARSLIGESANPNSSGLLFLLERGVFPDTVYTRFSLTHDFSPPSTLSAPSVASDGGIIKLGYFFQGQPTHHRAYIDADFNAATGFARDGIGADYLVEGTLLRAFTGSSSTTWSWNTVVGPEERETVPGRVQWRFDRGQVGAGNTPHRIRVAYEAEAAGPEFNRAGPITLQLAARQAQRLAIPAYFVPDLGGFWQRIVDSVPDVGLVIVNPASGPGTQPDIEVDAQIDAVRAAGVEAIGYVYTKTKTTAFRPVEQVLADIDRYQQFYALDGYFLDQASDTCDALPYYQQVVDHIRARNRLARIVLNPGKSVPECFAPLADVIINFEAWHSRPSEAVDYVRWAPDAWVWNHPRNKFWHLLHTTPEAELPSAMALARSRHVGWLYVTPDQFIDFSADNPWDSLPPLSYLNDQIAQARFLPVEVRLLGLATGELRLGLASEQLVLAGNGAAGFRTGVRIGLPYSVTVLQQPQPPGQQCVLANGAGTVSDLQPLVIQASCSDAGPGTPPQLAYAPAAGTAAAPGRITLAGPEGVGEGARGAITVTPSGGNGTGASATSTFSGCAFAPGTTGFSDFTGTLSFVGTSTTPQTRALICLRAEQLRTALLTCQESRGGAAPTSRSWLVTRPAGSAFNDDYIDEFEYDTAESGLGQLAKQTRRNSNGQLLFTESHSYDGIGRPQLTHTHFDGRNWESEVSYERYGRVDTVQDASNGSVTNEYTRRGYLLRARENDAASTPLVTVLEQDARGQTIRERKATGILTERTFNPATGLISSIRSAVAAGFPLNDANALVQNLGYEFDLIDNLMAREDRRPSAAGGGQREQFRYDTSNRLVRGELTRVAGLPVSNPITTIALTYDWLGNICSKQDPLHPIAQPYTYAGNAGCVNAQGQAGRSPHQVTAAFGFQYDYDLAGNRIRELHATQPGLSKRLTYDVMGQLIQSIQGALRTTFVYGPDSRRYRRVDQYSNGTTVTRYVGSVEFIESSTRPFEVRRYIGNDVLIVKQGSEAPQQRFLFSDHLGSVDAITDVLGNVIERLSFDAHGNRRAANWQALTPNLTSATTTRGFTRHEHVDGQNLIHMNGRVYDSLTGRFLQADPAIQNALDSQNWNRYSYMLNNPLSYTDPREALHNPAARAVLSYRAPSIGDRRWPSSLEAVRRSLS